MKAEAEEPLPDLTDFMNDWFFGAVDSDRCQIYNFNGEEGKRNRQEKEAGCGKRLPPLSTSRLTQEWLEEAKRMVAGGPPSRHSSPPRSGGGLKFVAASQAKEQTPPALHLDKIRDARSRSARRYYFYQGKFPF